METFVEWLVSERRQELVPREVLDGYEQGFQQALQQLLHRVQDPLLRDKFQGMLECPIQDARGRCHTFTSYIVNALIRHGIHRQADLEEVLAYIYSSLMFDRKVNGEPKATLFGSFKSDRPYSPQGNPLEARFKVSVANSIRNVAAGRIPRLFNRRQGTVSIGDTAENIPSRPDQDQEFADLLTDIRTLLHRKESAYGLPLVALFDSILGGQRQRFTDRVATMGRQIIVSTIRDYAKSSGNENLLQLLQLLDSPPAPTPKAAPAFSSTKEKDYASILAVVDRMGGRPVGSADLGRYRRRWLEYPPRDTASGQPNRMTEVLGQMLRDGALRKVPTGRGAMAYVAGPAAEKYRQGFVG